MRHFRNLEEKKQTGMVNDRVTFAIQGNNNEVDTINCIVA